MGVSSGRELFKVGMVNSVAYEGDVGGHRNTCFLKVLWIYFSMKMGGCKEKRGGVTRSLFTKCFR